MPHLDDWLAKLRLDKIYDIQDFIIEFESVLKTNESNVNECNESIESDIEYEESQFYESEDTNQ